MGDTRILKYFYICYISGISAVSEKQILCLTLLGSYDIIYKKRWD